LAYAVFSTGKHPTTSIYLQRLEPGAAPRLLLRDIEGCFVPFFAHGQLFAYTDFGAPNFRIVHIALDDPDPANWQDIVPQSDRCIQQFTVAGDRIFVTSVDRFSTQIEAFASRMVRERMFHFLSHALSTF